METPAIDVCFCCDINMVDGLVCVLASASNHLRRGVILNAHILDAGLGDDLCARVKETVQKHLLNVKLDVVKILPEKLDTFPEALRHNTKTTYSKLFLHELFPWVDRIIYLDCDILVKRDLTELYESSLGDKLIAAVRDKGVSTMGEHLENISEKFPEIDLSAFYFNAGVFVVNLESWRSRQAEKLFLETARFLEPRFADQSTLNVIFRGQWLELDTSWNRQIFLTPSQNRFADYDRAIWHFIRLDKPWDVAEVGARGLVAEWYREIRRVKWVPVAIPRVKMQAPLTKDALEWVKCSLKQSDLVRKLIQRFLTGKPVSRR